MVLKNRCLLLGTFVVHVWQTKILLVFTLLKKNLKFGHLRSTLSNVLKLTVIHLSVKYGINRNSILNTIPGFSVVTGLPHDIMHDLLEGVLNYELRLLLKHCFLSKYITVNLLNERIKNFNYGYTQSGSKPPEINIRCIQDDMKIRYSSSEMLTMANVFPFLIADKVPDSDENYSCFLILLQILSICIAPTVTLNMVSYLRVLIEEHHGQFRRIYSSESFIPKLHFMVHYPNQIIRHGPLVRSWTMRHEGKLNFFKQASRLSNFKNITLTMAKRHQLWLAYHLQTSSLFESEVTLGPVIQHNCFCQEDTMLSQLIQTSSLVAAQLSNETLITRLQWIKVNGIKYMANNAFLVISVSEDEPTFGSLKEIF